MEKPLLGVHLIVKNEEALLARCLESIRAAADEIIVVDTGSDDRTSQIAQSYGAKVVYSEWQDDFAQARNTGLSHAASEWVLIIDADEEVMEGIEKLPAFLRQTGAERCSVRIVSPVGDRHEERVEHESVRLFRTGQGYRFSGRIHEQLIRGEDYAEREQEAGEESSLGGRSIPLSPLLLNHTGYLPAELEGKRKPERNLRIIRKCLSESPGDPFHTYNLAVTYCQLGDWPQAAEAFGCALDAAPDAPYRPTLIRDYAKVLLALGQPAQAGELLQREVKRYPHYPDLHMLLGQCLEEQGLLADAFSAYGCALTVDKQTADGYITESGSRGYRACTGLGRIAVRQGEKELADRLYRQALTEHPHYEPALCGWADLLQLRGMDDEDIKQRLLEVLQPDGSSALAARALASCGAYAAALAVLQSPGAQQERALVCECLMQTGQFGAAALRFAAWRQEGGAELPAGSIADWALCCWSEQGTLPRSFYAAADPRRHAAYAALERWLSAGPGGGERAMPQVGPELLELAAQQLERAVELRLLQLSEQLAELAEPLRLRQAKALYRHGYVLPAADRLLALMDQGGLDAEGLFDLAEILYDKGFYGQSAALFEQALVLKPDWPRAHTGAALSYLQLAREVAADSIGKLPDMEPLKKDLRKLDQAVSRFGGLGWKTWRSGRQRRNADAAQSDFVMHDRQG
ncbi:SPBc2 prophage-derived glycosyltransferase SunS [Paenibacillus konkukensis]|uniref:SPBc2 prophage-derived glycosyltransferase SunS n=2 Tax=Paenibacillus konkukensis TaxID=2020716 RepID=A0ABY4RQH4_9BACL|nr:SPBc2 prophage-derived glycosyltransferase SunS [Paenibacillus konkukensis]